MKKLLHLCGLLLLLSLLTSCPFFLSIGPVSMKDTELTRVWYIEDAWPDLMPLSMAPPYLFIPLYAQGGLLCADLETGEVLWRYEELFHPLSDAVYYDGRVYIQGIIPGGKVSLFCFTIEGAYAGSFNLENFENAYPRVRNCRLYLIGDALIWPAYWGHVHSFDLSVPITELSPGELDPAPHHRILYSAAHDSDSIIVLGSSIVGIGDDIIFNYEVEGYPEVNKTIRLNRKTGAIVWEHDVKSHNFGEVDMLLIDEDRLLISGIDGWELIHPETRKSYWSIPDELLKSLTHPMVVGKTIYAVGAGANPAIAGFSLKTGIRTAAWNYEYGLWQPVREHKGIIYISGQDETLLYDTKKNVFIARDETHPGYSQQVNNPLKYKDLFIHFCDDIDVGGRVEALRMDYKR